MTTEVKIPKKKGRPRIHPIRDYTLHPKVGGKHGKGIPKTGRGAKGLERPHTWATGTDPLKHEMFFEWHLSRAQYNYRYKHKLDPGQWKLEFEDWCNLWEGKWHNRGRKADNFCISKINPEGDWTKNNIEIIERSHHTRKQADFKRLKKAREEKLKKKGKK